MKSRFKSTYKYRAPKLIYDKKQDQSYIEIFGGKRKYFRDEDEYRSYVRQDEKNKYRQFLQDIKEKKEFLKKMDRESKFPGLRRNDRIRAAKR